MIPAGDFCLNAYLVLGRLTCLLRRGGGWAVALEYAATIFWGSRTAFDQVYKGRCGRDAWVVIICFLLEGSRGRNLYAI